MIKNDLLHFYRNFQIIDVTEQCSFVWYQKPNSCRAYLEVSNVIGDFTEGETIENLTDGTSTAKVFSSYVNGDRVYIEDISGSFNVGDQIKGNSSGQTAVVDNFVDERSYPNNIITGVFPDSIISKDLDDYLEFETSRNGAGICAYLDVYPNEAGIYSVTWVLGIGKRVDSLQTTKYTRWRAGITTSDPINSGKAFSSSYRQNFANALCPSNIFLEKDDFIRVGFYQTDKATLRWRIRNIRVLKLIV